MRQLTGENFHCAVSAKSAAAIHFDAAWDVAYRPVVRQTMLDAERVLGDRVTFAEVDCDREVELARSIPVLNVPLVAYYREGKLIAALTGADQNVLARLERLLRNQPIGYGDGTTSSSPER